MDLPQMMREAGAPLGTFYRRGCRRPAATTGVVHRLFPPQDHPLQFLAVGALHIFLILVAREKDVGRLKVMAGTDEVERRLPAHAVGAGQLEWQAEGPERRDRVACHRIERRQPVDVDQRCRTPHRRG